MDTEIASSIKRLHTDVLRPLKQAFVEKDVIIDLLGIGLVAGENLFILGPPGTAKSAIVNQMSRRIEGQSFEYLLTRFTEPNELFGPFDIRQLREGVLETNTEGMLPEASFIFLDELLNANSAILNSLLTVLNEHALRRGREYMQLPFLMAVGASNHLPEDESLRALFDRFLMRVRSGNVGDDSLADVLRSGWDLENQRNGSNVIQQLALDEIGKLRALVAKVDLEPVQQSYVELINKLRRLGIPISDRRAVKVQRLIAASAILCERDQAHASDLWVLEHIWDLEEQREMLRAAVRESIDATGTSEGVAVHPRAESPEAPNPDELLKEIEAICATAGEAEDIPESLRDRLGAVDNRSQWVKSDESREFLAGKIGEAWKRLEK
ncbi:MAG: ATPase [Verrucomicrobiales bacterium]|nr:ATPase [Verrucomicrobiales bacterium]|tara:strand:+ start:6323 stop:7468 length:1146 start_codon:yes stop_codon:yes gene_type:complete